MAKRGIFSRLLSGVRNVFSPRARERERVREEVRREAREERPQRREEPPPRLPTREEIRERERAQRETRRERERREREEKRDDAKDTWNRVKKQERRRPQGSFEDHQRIFNKQPGVSDLDPDEYQEVWESYVRNMVYGGRGFRYNDPTENPFWSVSGIHPKEFDWISWRKKRKTP